MNRYQPIFGPLFFFSFVMIMIFILMSMFLSIINAAFKKVRIDNEMEGNELEMVNFIMSRFLTWTGFSKRRVEKGVKAKTKYIEGERVTLSEIYLCSHENTVMGYSEINRYIGFE